MDKSGQELYLEVTIYQISICYSCFMLCLARGYKYLSIWGLHFLIFRDYDLGSLKKKKKKKIQEWMSMSHQLNMLEMLKIKMQNNISLKIKIKNTTIYLSSDVCRKFDKLKVVIITIYFKVPFYFLKENKNSN